MTSFNYAITPTRGNWFQTNQPEHDESDDRAGNTVTYVRVTDEKELLIKTVVALFVLRSFFDFIVYRGVRRIPRYRCATGC